jgi:hypothetical protein
MQFLLASLSSSGFIDTIACRVSLARLLTDVRHELKGIISSEDAEENRRTGLFWPIWPNAEASTYRG